jgi:hypothetical protein
VGRTLLSLRFSDFEVTLSEVAGGEYLPLPRSKGGAFPSCSPSVGAPLLSQISLMNNGVLRRLRKLHLNVFIAIFLKRLYPHFLRCIRADEEAGYSKIGVNFIFPVANSRK